MPAARIKIYRRNEQIVDGRRQENAAKLHHVCWCEIKQLYGKELYSALEIRLENTIVFEVRYCRKVNEIKKSLKEFYVVYESENYDIFAVDLRQNEKQYVLLKANKQS